MGSGRHCSWCSSAYTPFEASYHAAPILHHITSRFAWVRGPFPTVPWITFQECQQHNFLLRWSHVNDMGLRGLHGGWRKSRIAFCEISVVVPSGRLESMQSWRWRTASVLQVICGVRLLQSRDVKCCMNNNWTIFCVSTNSSNGFWGHVL